VKRLILVLMFTMIAALSFADITITVNIDGDPAYTVTVPDDAVVVVEKTPVVETVVVPINP